MMSIVKNFYLSDEVGDKLRDVENQSKLINDLLLEYFSKSEPKQLTLEHIQKLKEEKFNTKTNINEDWDALMKQENLLLKTEEEKQKKEEEKRKGRFNSYAIYLKEFFEIEDGEIPELSEMYEIERHQYTNLFDWGKAKGLVPKVEEEEEKPKINQSGG